MLYTVRLGPSFYWDLTEHIGMSLGAGPAVGIVSGDYKYDETITAGGISARNAGQIGGTDLVYGGYVNAAVMYHVLDNADIYIGAQYHADERCHHQRRRPGGAVETGRAALLFRRHQLAVLKSPRVARLISPPARLWS